MKINKVELIEDAPIYKSIIGSILNKEPENNSFIVKTKDNFINVTEFEFEENINIGDSFEI